MKIKIFDFENRWTMLMSISVWSVLAFSSINFFFRHLDKFLRKEVERFAG